MRVWLSILNLKSSKNIGKIKSLISKEKLIILSQRLKRQKPSEKKNLKTEYTTLEESVGKEITEDEFDRLAEKKDACYHKVKSRYKVWPSAYASGALVQCRKKGAKNWGNKRSTTKRQKKKA